MYGLVWLIVKFKLIEVLYLFKTVRGTSDEGDDVICVDTKGESDGGVL